MNQNYTKTILILPSNPIDTSRLRLDEEVREITAGLQRSLHRELFDIKHSWAIRIRDIRRALLDHKPYIVHFCGHGDENGLAVEDEYGNASIISSESLAGLFELFADQVECVILNACYSQLQVNSINKHIKYVVGMSDEITDKAAIEFAVGFYDALGAGRSVEDAYKFGCNAIRLFDIPEYLTPTLNRKPEMQAAEYEPTFDLILYEKSPALFAKLREIRAIIHPILKSIPNTLYSYNSDGHARQVLRLISELYCNVLKVHLSAEELFALGLLCLVHDIGMMLRDGITDSHQLYLSHAQCSHDYVFLLAEEVKLDRGIASKVAALCLIHNKPFGRAEGHLAALETEKFRLNLLFLMFRIADMLEVEMQPGEILRMSPNVITSTIGDFDIDSAGSIISIMPAPGANLIHFESWAQALRGKLLEAENAFSLVDLTYHVHIAV